MPVQRTYRGLVSRAMRHGPYHAGLPSLHSLQSKLGHARANQRVPSHGEMKHLYARGYLEKKHYTSYLKSIGKSRAKSGGGGGSRSEAARKAWRTRRGH